MLLTMESLDELVGFGLSDDGFFSTGVVIIIDNKAWELIEEQGSDLVFKKSKKLQEGLENMNFFMERAI